MNPRLFYLLGPLVLCAVSPMRAETATQVIAKARAYLGSEVALNAVSTIHFTGTLETTTLVPSPDDKTKQVEEKLKLPADIVFQKDYQQRITITGPGVIETTALDGYDAWQKRTNPKNPSQWTITLLDAGQVKKLRANTWENLSFFAGLEKKGGTVQHGGDATADGVACVKLSFVHAADIVFVRFFDKATGRLIKTQTENGAEIREEGEMIVNGVRFPRKVINKSPNGTVTTITFDRVELNQRLPAGEFAVPTLKPN
jgi:hypothetical protein